MKSARVTVLFLLLSLCLGSVTAVAATEEDAKSKMTECGIGETVSDSDNLMGISLKEVHLDDDGDVYIQWEFSNEIMTGNMGYAYSQMRFFDPDDLETPYTAFTMNDDGTISMTFKEGDSISFLDFVHLNHEEFNPESGVIFMYFNGSGEDAPEEFYTSPLTFTIYVDDDGPHALETTPRYAPEAMVTAFAGN